MTTDLPQGVVTGIGSLPGTSPRDAARRVVSELPELPHVPELPERGPWADMIGRGCALLTDLPTELEAGRWRVAQRSGRDLRRARALLVEDLDAVEEGWDGYSGAAKLQVCGPLTLAAVLELRGGDPALSDRGALDDITASLTEGVLAHLSDVRRRVPAARWVVQVDEPALSAVTAGAVPRASGWGTVAALTSAEAGRYLSQVTSPVSASGAATVVHSCAHEPDLTTLEVSGADALSLPLSHLDVEANAPALERWYHGGHQIWCGIDVGAGPDNGIDVSRHLDRLGAVLEVNGLVDSLVLTPPCGLAMRAASPVGGPFYADLQRARRQLLEAQMGRGELGDGHDGKRGP